MSDSEGKVTERRKPGWKRFWKFPRTFAEVKSMGWKFVLLFVLFYLIRDTILYLLLPYLIYEGVFAP